MFQSLVRDSAHSDPRHGDVWQPDDWFQSLVRDSAHSDHVARNQSGRLCAVSIPRSGFCPFRLRARLRHNAMGWSFNPSFGILPIQTRRDETAFRCDLEFQSLVRDSAHSDKLRHSRSPVLTWCFNPSFGILPIQTKWKR